MKYELILFDIDGTLFDYRRAESYALEKAFNKFGLDYREDEHLVAYKKINKSFWRQFEEEKVSAIELRTKRFEELVAFIKADVDPKNMAISYLDFLKEGTFLFSESKPLIDEIHGKCKLALITNGLKEVQRPRIKSSELEGYFDYIIISDEVGVPKPSKGIFEHAFELCEHVDKNTAIIIGDSLTSDILGGNNFGIDTCWFNPDNKNNDLDIKPTYEITKLSEVKKIIV